MTKEKLIALLNTMPDGTLIYVRIRDDAYPASLRCFTEPSASAPAVLYFDHVVRDPDGGHRNFPEGYQGVSEIPVDGRTAGSR